MSDPRLLAILRQAAEVQGVCLPELAPSQTCSCPNCSREKQAAGNGCGDLHPEGEKQ